MKKIRKEFEKMDDVVNFLKTLEVKKDVKKEIERIVENIEKTLGCPDAEINNHEYFGNTYKKEFYFSDIHLSINSYNENFGANIRIKNNSIRLIVLINSFKYQYNYDNGSESDEKAVIKIAYTN